MKSDTELFYEFLVQEGVLFQFLEMINKSEKLGNRKRNLIDHCKHKERHEYVYWILFGRGHWERTKEGHTFWSHIHNRWNKYYKRYGK